MRHIKTENEFYEIIQSEEKVLIDFYAEWCNPCKVMGTILESIDSIPVIKIDIDRFRNIAKEYKVMTIPSLKIFSSGEVIKEKTGLMSKDELINFINE